MNNSNRPNDKLFSTKALELTIRIGLVLLLIFWCFRIAQPFIEIIIWSIIIAVAIKPGYDRLKYALGKRGRLTATIVTLLALILLIVPTYILSESLINYTKVYYLQLKEGTLNLPPPKESIESWPIIGEPLFEVWGLASNNLEVAVQRVSPQIRDFSRPLLSSAAGAALWVLKLMVSIVIAGVLLEKSSGGSQLALALSTRLRGKQGGETVQLATATVRSVALGILGVALIQSLLAGIGFVIVGVPGAGLWALLVLILAVVQLPTILIMIPIIIYVFTTSSTVIAVPFAIWCILVGLTDNILKPLLIGRGVDVPMLVIFIGAIGGFIKYGIFGLFVGAIVLAVGYKLFLLWLYNTQNEL